MAKAQEGPTGETMSSSIGFRWLGTAGVELRVKDQILVVDPYFTRCSFWKLWFGRARPDTGLIAEKIRRCDFLLVTHAHFDHIMDVPDVVQNTGAAVWGSPNSCRLLSACGVPQDKIHEVVVGDEFALGDFHIEVRRCHHVELPGFQPGPLLHDLKPPLRIRDYRMDHYYSFRITIQGLRLLTDPGSCPEEAGPADAVFVIPFQDRGYYETLLEVAKPKVIIAYHFDDHFRSLSKPLCPCFKPPRWEFPPLQRMSVKELKQMIEGISPETGVLIPEAFRAYDLGTIRGPAVPIGVPDQARIHTKTGNGGQEHAGRAARRDAVKCPPTRRHLLPRGASRHCAVECGHSTSLRPP